MWGSRRARACGVAEDIVGERALLCHSCSSCVCVCVWCRGDGERDVFNEKPSKEEQLSVAETSGRSAVTDFTILHTTMGDIHIKLFPERWVGLGVGR